MNVWLALCKFNPEYPNCPMVQNMKKIKTLVIIASLLLLSTPLLAGDGDCISVQSGNWEDPATWNCGGIPRLNFGAIISAGHEVTINGDALQLNQVVIQATGQLTVGDGSPQNDITIQVQDDGFDFSQGTLALNTGLNLENTNPGSDTLLGTTDGSFGLNVTAQDTVQLAGDMGATTPLQAVEVSGGSGIEISAGTLTADLFLFHDPVVVKNSPTITTLVAGIIFARTLDATPNEVNQLSLIAGNGTVTFSGDVGVTDRFLDFAVEANAVRFSTNQFITQRRTDLLVNTIYLDSPNGSVHIEGSTATNNSTRVTIGNPGSVVLPDDAGASDQNLNLIAGYNMTINANLGSETEQLNDITLSALNKIFVNSDHINANSLTVNDLIQFNRDMNLNVVTADFLGEVIINFIILSLNEGSSEFAAGISSSGQIVVAQGSTMVLTADTTFSGTVEVAGNLNFESPITGNNPLPNAQQINFQGGSANVLNLSNLRWAIAANQTLSGYGNIVGELEILNGGNLKPQQGTLRVDFFNMVPGANFVVDYDEQISIGSLQWVVSGSIIDANLIADLSGHDGSTYNVIRAAAMQPLSGRFINQPEGSQVSDDYTITYSGGNGFDVVLEPACVQNTTVTNNNDSGPGSLREAVSQACTVSETQIDFDDNYTIELSSPISVDDWVTLQGSGQTLSGAETVGILDVSDSGTLTLDQINVTNSGVSAIFNQGTLNVINSYFANNASGNSSLGGGAIRNFNELSVTHSAFYQNNSERGGAIFNDGSAETSIENSTFFENGTQETGEGGAIHNRGVMLLNNSTLLDSGDGEFTVANSIFNWGSNANLTINNTVIASDSTRTECLNTNNATVNGTHYLIDDGTCGAPLQGDPLLGDWANNGGFAQSVLPLSGSPLINAGDNGSCNDFDQVGTPRPQGAVCDIGAIELVDNNPPSVSRVSEGGIQLAACDSRNTEVTIVELSFNEYVLNAEDPLNYWLRFTGADNSFDDFEKGKGDDTFWSPMQVDVSGDNNTPVVTLTFAEAIPDGLVRLEVSDDIVDQVGNPLNGGDYHLLQFRVERENLFKNAHFDCGDAGIDTPWDVTFDSSSDWSNLDVIDSDNSGSAEWYGVFESENLGLAQCQNINGGLPLGLAAAFRFEPFNVRAPENGISGGSETFDVTLYCESWDQADCMGNSLGEESTAVENITTANQWHSLSVLLPQPPVNAQSVYCGVRTQTHPGGSQFINFDQMKLSENDVIFINGFE